MTVSKLLAFVVKVTRPPKGAVQRNQTLLSDATSLVKWRGSPGSPVAPWLLTLTVFVCTGRAIAAAKASFAGGGPVAASAARNGDHASSAATRTASATRIERD